MLEMLEISRGSDPEEFLEYVNNRLLNRERLEPFLEEKNAPWSFEKVVDFWRKYLAERIKEKWNYERGGGWGEDRSTQLAVEQAVLQSLSSLAVEAEFVIEKGGGSYPYLPGTTIHQAQEIYDKAILLGCYFEDLFSSQKTHQPVQC